MNLNSYALLSVFITIALKCQTPANVAESLFYECIEKKIPASLVFNHTIPSICATYLKDSTTPAHLVLLHANSASEITKIITDIIPKELRARIVFVISCYQRDIPPTQEATNRTHYVPCDLLFLPPIEVFISSPAELRPPTTTDPEEAPTQTTPPSRPTRRMSLRSAAQKREQTPNNADHALKDIANTPKSSRKKQKTFNPEKIDTQEPRGAETIREKSSNMNAQKICPKLATPSQGLMLEVA